MKIISWNTRGLNGAHKEELVRNMIRDQRPNFLLIQETKMKRYLVSKLSFSKFMNIDAIDSEGVSRGVLMLYNKRVYKMSPIYNANNALLCKVAHIHSDDTWFILNLYAPNSKRERKALWAKISAVITINNIDKRIIMGDLNFPLTDGEKYGGLTPDQESKLDLSNFIHNLAFMDFDLLGGRFTWSNRRIGGECIQIHLDRAFISPRWLQSHFCRLSLLPKVGLDHSPISLCVFPLTFKRTFPFHFEKMWITHPTLETKISSWWNIEVEGTAMYKVAQKLKNVKRNIKIWNKSDFGHIF